jgi:hypothetical protein
MNKTFNKKIIFIFLIVIISMMNFVSILVVNAQEEITPINIYGDTELGKKAKERAKEDVIKLQQGESIEETEAERTIRESRERDTQKQIIKLQKKATEQDKEFVPLETIPGVIEGGNTDLNQFFNGLFKFGIIIAGFLAVVMIAVGGIQYMSTDAIHGKSEGRERITYALMGLLLILFSWILLNTVNPDILDFSNDALFK